MSEGFVKTMALCLAVIACVWGYRMGYLQEASRDLIGHRCAEVHDATSIR